MLHCREKSIAVLAFLKYTARYELSALSSSEGVSLTGRLVARTCAERRTAAGMEVSLESSMTASTTSNV